MKKLEVDKVITLLEGAVVVGPMEIFLAFANEALNMLNKARMTEPEKDKMLAIDKSRTKRRHKRTKAPATSKGKAPAIGKGPAHKKIH